MTRAIPVATDFDPVPSLKVVPAITVAVTAQTPAGADLVAVLIGSGTAAGSEFGDLGSVGFTAGFGETHVVAGAPAKVVAGVGAGPLTLGSARDVGAAIAKSLPSAKAIAIEVGDIPAEVAQGLVEASSWRGTRGTHCAPRLPAPRSKPSPLFPRRPTLRRALGAATSRH